MDFYSLIFLSCALGMDAFAVSLCKGFSVKKLHLKHYLIVLEFILVDFKL